MSAGLPSLPVPWEGVSAWGQVQPRTVGFPPSTLHTFSSNLRLRCEGREEHLLCLRTFPEHLWSEERSQQELRKFSGAVFCQLPALVMAILFYPKTGVALV